jgi:hypothetical protein
MGSLTADGAAVFAFALMNLFYPPERTVEMSEMEDGTFDSKKKGPLVNQRANG